MSETSPTPSIGRPLPRASDAYTTPEKIAWILAAHGHGPEWTRVLRIDEDDTERLWTTIYEATLSAPISAIRDLHPFGVACELRLLLTLDARTTPALTAWHYESPGDAPRLITAYPTT